MITTIIASGAILWTSATYELQNKMIDIGWSKTNSEYIINECKATAKDPRKCAIYAASIWANETQACKFAFKNSCFWVQKWYDSEKESIKDWIKKWNKWWYKAKWAHHFYSNKKGIKPKTNYCLSEYQPDWKLLSYCPNWYKNVTFYLQKLQK